MTVVTPRHLVGCLPQAVQRPDDGPVQHDRQGRRREHEDGQDGHVDPVLEDPGPAERRPVSHRGRRQAGVLGCEQHPQLVEDLLAPVQLDQASAAQRAVAGPADGRDRVAGPPGLGGPLDPGQVPDQWGFPADLGAKPGCGRLLGGPASGVRVEEPLVAGETVAAHPGLLVDQGPLQPVGLGLGWQDRAAQLVGRRPGLDRQRRHEDGGQHDQEPERREHHPEPALDRECAEQAPALRRSGCAHGVAFQPRWTMATSSASPP